MEKILKRVFIIFIVCIIGVSAIIFTINYNNNKLIKRKGNDQKEEIKDKESEKVIKQEENNQLKQETNNTNNINNQNNDSAYIEANNHVEDDYIPVIKFNVKIQNNRLYIGDTTKLTTTIFPDNATDQEISYQSSNKNIAIVSKNGVVTAVNPGECYITITVKNAGSGQIKVIVLSKNNTVYNNDNTNDSVNENIEEYNKNIKDNQQPIINDIPNQDTNDSLSTDATNNNIDSNQNTDDVSNNNINNNANSNNSKPSTPNQVTTDQSSNSTNESKVVKNGWYRENNKKYYYKDNQLVKNAYIDYIYLDGNGIAKEKIGNFNVTLYGATAWANQNLNMREKSNQSSSKIGTIPTGGKMKILSSENSSTKYIKVKYNNKIGYVYSPYIYINLPDVMPDIIYSISNANKSIYKTSGKSIPNVTGVNLYGFKKKYNEKIGKTTYYTPLLYPVAKQLQKAYNKAVKQGYNLKIYDTYRPYDVSMKINKEFKSLYNSNKKVKNGIDYDKEGKYWGTGWFLANSISRHNRGVAIDLTLTDKDGNELKAQTSMHTLDTRSVRKYNNSTANKLSSIMTSVGFETLDSEWWHFQEDNYKNSAVNSFRIK